MPAPRWWIYLALVSAVGALQPVPPKTIRSSTSSRQSSSNIFPQSTPWQQQPHRLQENGGLLSLSAAHESAVDIPDITETNAVIQIKPAKFHNLRAVSRLLVAEFYGPSLWSPAQCLVELNRLQKNFHSYGEDASRHLMLLATSVDDGSLVGFVDIDGREKRPGQTKCLSIRRYMDGSGHTPFFTRQKCISGRTCLASWGIHMREFGRTCPTSPWRIGAGEGASVRSWSRLVRRRAPNGATTTCTSRFARETWLHRSCTRTWGTLCTRRAAAGSWSRRRATSRTR
ncbi:unnamed protein product [Pylaiella littoralis]